MVLHSDGYLTFKEEARPEEGSSEEVEKAEKARRFFKLVKRLPLHLQKEVAKGYIGVEENFPFVRDDVFCLLLRD